MANLRITRPFFPGTMREEFVTPFSQLFDDIFERTFPEFKSETGIQFTKGSFPKVDVIDHTDSIEIIAEIPGWKKEDLTIKCENGILTLSGKAQEKGEDKSQNYIIKELKRSSFQRSFQLTDKLNEENIQANFDEGLLRISVGKKEVNLPPPSRVIEIK
jgi:HSP20 family protein